MDHHPSDPRLVSSDLVETGGRYSLKLIELLRRRRRPLLFVVDESGNVIHWCRPDWDSPEDDQSPTEGTSALTVRAAHEVQRLIGGDNEQCKDTERQIITDEPNEKCAIVTLDRQPWCLRIFKLDSSAVNSDVRYSALLEPIKELEAVKTALQNVQGLSRLSKREADVVEELVSGSTDKQIANQLGISVETVRAYLKSIRAKLGVSTRTAIVSVMHNLREDSERRGD